jgi:hypothetical protein
MPLDLCAYNLHDAAAGVTATATAHCFRPAHIADLSHIFASLYLMLNVQADSIWLQTGALTLDLELSQFD